MRMEAMLKHSPVSPGMGRHYRTVVVDDHPVTSMAIRDLLDGHGEFQVVAQCADAAAALDAIDQHAPRLAIIDLGLPGLDGVSLMRQLRGGGSPLALLAISGADAAVAGIRALRAGADGFFHKQGDPRDLLLSALLVARGKSSFDWRVLEAAAAPSPAARIDQLTPRERDIFRLILRGRSNLDIAATLGLRPKSVSATRSVLMRKLGLRTLKEALDFAAIAGLEP
jgi:DNA-binding NarL/FixJ family response regulator